MKFSTYDGKVFLRSVDDCLTPYGGLVQWAAFQKKSQVLEKLTEACPIKRSSPNASSVYDILCSFMLTALCDGSRFSHVGRLREAPSVTELFKLKMTSNVKRAISAVHENQWQGISTRGLLQTAELQLQLHGWSSPRRVVVTRKLLQFVPAAVTDSFWDKPEYELAAYVTSLPQESANGWQILELYNRRGDCENIIDELKRSWGFNGFCCRDSAPTAIAARLTVLTYNLWNLFMRLMKTEKHMEAFQSRRWFLLIAARLVKHGRQKELQISVKGQWWHELRDSYQRFCRWLDLTAPQLNPWDMFQPALL